jgi:hypothetical protein
VSATSLATRLTVFLIAAVALAVAVQITVSYRAVERALYADAFATYRAVAHDLAFRIQRSLDNDLPLEMLSYVRDIIDRERIENSAINRIVVTNDAGRAIFDTDPARIGRRVPADWLPPAPGETRWLRETGNDVITGRSLALAGTAKGALIVLQSRTDIEGPAGAILLRLVRAGVLVVVAVTFAAVAIFLLLTRPLRLWSGAVIAGIDRALAADSQPSSPAADDPAADDSVDPATQIGTAEARLRHAEQELMRFGTRHAA